MMNIHKEYDIFTIFVKNPHKESTYIVDMKGQLSELEVNPQGIVYTAYDNFYIHSGQEEFISYNTIAPDGRVIEVNRFIALHKNPGIKRVDGSRG